MEKSFSYRLDTPLGPLMVTFSSKGLAALDFIAGEAPPEAVPGSPPASWMQETLQALKDYFAGGQPDLAKLRLDPQGTPFQRQVWEALKTIPPGKTLSYAELARKIGRPQAARAVGQACGANPIPILIPCHRVVAANGSLGGFSSGLEHKRWLLKHEGVKGEERGGKVEKAKRGKGKNQ